MSVVPQQVIDFLKTSAPFDQLNEEEMAALARQANLIYLTDDNKSSLLKENAGRLFLIQNGQFSVKDSGQSERHLSEGDYFGYHALLDKVAYQLEVKVDKPGLVYCFTADAFEHACSYPAIADFFHGTRTDALQNQAVVDSNSMWLYKPVHEVIDHLKGFIKVLEDQLFCGQHTTFILHSYHQHKALTIWQPKAIISISPVRYFRRMERASDYVYNSVNHSFGTSLSA